MISSWRTYAAHLANLFASSLLPFNKICPYNVKPLVLVVMRPVRIERRDDLPAPDWPIIVRN